MGDDLSVRYTQCTIYPLKSRIRQLCGIGRSFVGCFMCTLRVAFERVRLNSTSEATVTILISMQVSIALHDRPSPMQKKVVAQRGRKGRQRVGEETDGMCTVTKMDSVSDSVLVQASDWSVRNRCDAKDGANPDGG